MNDPYGTDQLERMLGQEMHDRADGLSGLPFGLDEVKGKARRIRRNRRIAGGVAVAAAVGVIVPTVMTVSGGLQSQREIPPAPQPDAPVEVVRATLTLDGLERGEDPAVEYFTPDGVVLPEEGLQELDASYQAMIPNPADGGWIAVEPAGDGVRYFSEDFEPQGGSATTGSIVTTPDRQYVAWSAPEAGAQSLGIHSTTDPDSFTVWDFPEFPTVVPVGFLAEDTLVYNTQEGEQTGVGVAEADGTTSELPRAWVQALDASPAAGAFTVQTSSTLDGGCFAVVDADSRRPTWETCEQKLGAFSPDGRFVLATDVQSDGFGLRTLSVLDAETGDLVARFGQASDGAIDLVGAVWESDDAIVTMAAEGETQTLLRLNLDGSVEEVAERVQGEYGDRWFYFGQDRTTL